MNDLPAIFPLSDAELDVVTGGQTVTAISRGGNGGRGGRGGDAANLNVRIGNFGGGVDGNFNEIAVTNTVGNEAVAGAGAAGGAGGAGGPVTVQIGVV
jgi:hypothetical protein